MKNVEGKVACETDEVLRVWKSHFGSLGTPKEDPRYDSQHYDRVTEKVRQYNAESDVDIFSAEPFSEDEIETAIKSLNKGLWL